PYFNSAGPFKSEYGWGKGFVHEGGIREPFIACWPGKINPGSESLHQLSFYDVMPTLAELTGAEPPPTDGISFLPALMGKTDEQAAHEFLYWEFPEYDGQQAVRMGDWKGIRLELHKGPSEIQLFDLKSDPAESHDIASGHPEIVEKIRRIMETQHKEPELTRFRMAALGDEVAKN
ncbi:MAG: sulfatase-like hydrolase/transferase, partial [Lewinella sp.]|nr:sulfatase-like hydrolase/transferase [Lewinella sp.]